MNLSLPMWPPAWPEIEHAVAESLRSGDWGRYTSTACQQLRTCLARMFNVDHVRLCPSGTAAIELALRTVSIVPGDEVIVAAYDYPGNFRCIELLGAIPVLVDVIPGSVTLDPDQLIAAASDRTKGVIVSHLYGQAASLDNICHVCQSHGWMLIEDACQVPGMDIGGRPAGSWGDVGAISFGGSKLLTAGSGGALLTRDPRIAARLGPWLDRPSDMLPLGPLQATVLLPQLERLSELNALRRQHATALLAAAPTRLPTWRPIPTTSTPCLDANRPVDENQTTAYYKLAWLARSAEHRQRIVATATSWGIPLGAGFRSTASISTRRCRKPLPLVHSLQLGEVLFVLDHVPLMIDPSEFDHLLNLLVQLHDATV